MARRSPNTIKCKLNRVNPLELHLRTNRITLIEFSKISGIKAHVIGHIINGRQSPPITTAYQIDKATEGKVTMKDLAEWVIEFKKLNNKKIAPYF